MDVKRRVYVCVNKFQELLKDEEAAVASHQTLQDAYNKCCVWIRTFSDKLASCSEGQSEKEKLQANIDRIKVIFSFIFSIMPVLEKFYVSL